MQNSMFKRSDFGGPEIMWKCNLPDDLRAPGIMWPSGRLTKHGMMYDTYDGKEMLPERNTFQWATEMNDVRENVR